MPDFLTSVTRETLVLCTFMILWHHILESAVFAQQTFHPHSPPKSNPITPLPHFCGKSTNTSRGKFVPFSPQTVSQFFMTYPSSFILVLLWTKDSLFHWPRVSWHYLWLLSAIFHLIRFLLLLFALCADIIHHVRKFCKNGSSRLVDSDGGLIRILMTQLYS